MPSFRLDIEQWIPVEFADGRLAEVSLAEVFELANSIRRIQGNPLEVAVLHRLALAIFHRSFSLEDAGDWCKSWENTKPALEAAEGYVKKNGEKWFDLYHPDRPFMQHPDLKPGEKKMNVLLKKMNVLLYDRARGNNPVFLDASLDEDFPPIRSKEAARAMLVNFAFGGSHPDKSNPLRTDKELTMYAGPLCAKLVVIIEGSTLAETLMLNRLVGKKVKVGRPAWERCIAPQPTASEAEGIADRFTRTTRFVRLLPSDCGQWSSSAAVHMGERILEGKSPQDPMMPLYFGKDEWKVVPLDAGRALWRSSHLLLNLEERKREARPAETMLQLRRHCNRMGIAPKVGLRVIGVAGNAKGPKTDIWRDETLPFRVSLNDDTTLYANLVWAIEFAEKEATRLKDRLRSFAWRYLEAAVPSPDTKDVNRLAESLAPGLSTYWSRLAPSGERLGLGEVSRGSWEDQVKEASQKTFQQAMDLLPVTGRRLRAQFEQAKQQNKK